MSRIYRLADLVDLLRGRVPANTVPEPKGPRFFGIAEITARGNAAPRYVEYDPDIVDNAVELKEGDIAMSLMSNIGDAALIDTATEGAVLGRECVALRVTRPNVIRPAWLSAWTASEEFKSQVALHTTGTTMARLGLNALASFSITIPSMEEQRDVEDLVHRFNTAIARTAATLTDLQRLRDAELQLAMATTEERP